MTELQDEVTNCTSKLVQEANALARVNQNFCNAAVSFNTRAELDEARTRIKSVMSGLQWLLNGPLKNAERLAIEVWEEPPPSTHTWKGK